MLIVLDFEFVCFFFSFFFTLNKQVYYYNLICKLKKSFLKNFIWKFTNLTDHRHKKNKNHTILQNELKL